MSRDEDVIRTADSELFKLGLFHNDLRKTNNPIIIMSNLKTFYGSLYKSTGGKQI